MAPFSRSAIATAPVTAGIALLGATAGIARLEDVTPVGQRVETVVAGRAAFVAAAAVSVSVAADAAPVVTALPNCGAAVCFVAAADAAPASSVARDTCSVHFIACYPTGMPDCVPSVGMTSPRKRSSSGVQPPTSGPM
jgi:hypothetical protein